MGNIKKKKSSIECGLLRKNECFFQKQAVGTWTDVTLMDCSAEGFFTSCMGNVGHTVHTIACFKSIDK